MGRLEFRVMVMDGRRLDRILITKLPSADDPKKRKVKALRPAASPALKEAPKIKDRCSGGLFVCGEKAT